MFFFLGYARVCQPVFREGMPGMPTVFGKVCRYANAERKNLTLIWRFFSRKFFFPSFYFSSVCFERLNLVQSSARTPFSKKKPKVCQVCQRRRKAGYARYARGRQKSGIPGIPEKKTLTRTHNGAPHSRCHFCGRP